MAKNHYFFIGIGGIGMSGLAKILLERGEDVSGSDPATNKQTRMLEDLGAQIFHTHAASNIADNVNIVVYTSAVKNDNPELAEARKRGLEIMTRSQLLNKIITEQRALAVTGTHGKTTTSSMLMMALDEAGMDTTAVIGAEVHTIAGNAKTGKGKYSVAEVCEYERAFLDIYPHAAIITNIEADHLDYYEDLDEIVEAFCEFVSHIDPDGYLVYLGNSETTNHVATCFAGHKASFGLEKGNEYFATNIQLENSSTTLEIMKGKEKLGTFKLHVPGRHNILNAISVVALADLIGADMQKVAIGLEHFMGAGRRFEYKGSWRGATIIDDYAHHPTEIQATLSAARERYPENRIIAVFQPHQHSRTRLLMDDFARSFGDADLVILPEIYAVRDTEEDIRSVSSLDLANKINAQEDKPKAQYSEDFETVQAWLEGNVQKDDIILTIGAGPVFQIGESLLRK